MTPRADGRGAETPPAVQEFTYLLNAMERAAHAVYPSEEGYGEKRQAVFDFVRRLATPATPGATALAEVRESLSCAIAFSARDYGLDKRDAWVYGIVLGWGDALPSVAQRHGWSEEDVARLERLRRAFRASPRLADGGEPEPRICTMNARCAACDRHIGGSRTDSTCEGRADCALKAWNRALLSPAPAAEEVGAEQLAERWAKDSQTPGRDSQAAETLMRCAVELRAALARPTPAGGTGETYSATEVRQLIARYHIYRVDIGGIESDEDGKEWLDRNVPAAPTPASGAGEPFVPPLSSCPKTGGSHRVWGTYTCPDCNAELGASEVPPDKWPRGAASGAGETERRQAVQRARIALRTIDLDLLDHDCVAEQITYAIHQLAEAAPPEETP